MVNRTAGIAGRASPDIRCVRYGILSVLLILGLSATAASAVDLCEYMQRTRRRQPDSTLIDKLRNFRVFLSHYSLCATRSRSLSRGIDTRAYVPRTFRSNSSNNSLGEMRKGFGSFTAALHRTLDVSYLHLCIMQSFAQTNNRAAAFTSSSPEVNSREWRRGTSWADVYCVSLCT